MIKNAKKFEVSRYDEWHPLIISLFAVAETPFFSSFFFIIKQVQQNMQNIFIL